MDQKETTLIILGAGCSLKRYPLAKDMLTHLKDFGNTLADDAQRLRKLVYQTVDLLSNFAPKEKHLKRSTTLPG